MVPGGGIEPPLPFESRISNPALVCRNDTRPHQAPQLCGFCCGLEERLEVSLRNQPDANLLANEAHIRFELGQFDRFPALVF